MKKIINKIKAKVKKFKTKMAKTLKNKKLHLWVSLVIVVSLLALVVNLL